jgi:hypothetical protein
MNLKGPIMARQQVKRGTYQVELYNGDKYILGNSYKPWYTHATEFGIRKHREQFGPDMFKSVQYCEIPFVDDGGLKWCAAEIYQSVIDDVAKETGKQLTPFSEYVFTDQPKELLKLRQELAKW